MITSGVRFLASSVLGLALVSGLGARAAAAEAANATKFRYLDRSGQPALTLEVREGAVDVSDGKGVRVGTIKLGDDRVKFRDASDVERLKVKRKENGAEIEDGAGTRLYRVKLKDEGKIEIEDASGRTVAKAKPKESGFEVRRESGDTIAKVKIRPGKLVFETEGGERIGDLDGASDARAGVWLAVDQLPIPERAALWAYFAKVAP
ncbi:MAG: hypothetical protein U0610_08180 [bacterium]